MKSSAANEIDTRRTTKKETNFCSEFAVLSLTRALAPYPHCVKKLWGFHYAYGRVAPRSHRTGWLDCDEFIFQSDKARCPEFRDYYIKLGHVAVKWIHDTSKYNNDEIRFHKSKNRRSPYHVLSSTARTLALWVRIPREVWMYVRVFLCAACCPV
jgi:hypothetical protein